LFKHWLRKLIPVPGAHAIPQFFINHRHVCGYGDLYALERRGEPDQWVAQSAA